MTDAATLARPIPRLRPAAERGGADHGWLKTAHSFSFAEYHDRRHMHFETLRVINDDWVGPGGGFPMHPHKDFEIFSYLLDGALQHRDSMGNGSIVRAGGIQYMSAGSGVLHSEFNPSQTEGARLLQIWLIPNVRGAVPRYAQLDVTPAEKDGRLRLILAPDADPARADALPIRQDARIYAATLTGAQKIHHDLAPGRKAWVQMARGALTLNGARLTEGDGAAIEQSGALEFSAGEGAEFLLFDLAPLA